MFAVGAAVTALHGCPQSVLAHRGAANSLTRVSHIRAAGPEQYIQSDQYNQDHGDAFKAVAEKGKGPVLLRLAFHDAATFSKAGGGDGGANASIQFELDRPENAGLKRGWRVVQAAAARLKGTSAEGLVSMAVMIALGGAHGVKICGGPSISVPVGRQDAAAADPGGRLPAESLSATNLKAVFADKGLDTHDLVVLSGAHTLGGKGFGDPLTFDGTYYKTLLKKPWADPTAEMGKMIGLPSDHVLPEDDECLGLIQAFAASPDDFYQAFVPAYVKLTCLGARWN
ncbi:hypothetical protein WJX84_009924 [Apatococcus fuscideae]|uniref:L-ascorbate peroxidase n=1 Tax=Apatococcus fuscideae TaxID=2026836 RepID=A0AAW1T9V1_9CHLO